MIKKLVSGSIFCLLLFKLFALDLAYVKSKALDNNPELLTEKETLESAKWDYKAAQFSLLPSAKLESAYTSFNPGITNGPNSLDSQNSYGISINQPIFMGGKLFLASSIKANVLEISKHSYKSKRLEVITNTENKYFRVLETKELYKIAQKDYVSAQQHEEIAKVRAENGSISASEYLNMRSVTASKKLRMIQSKNAYDLSINDLVNYANIEITEGLEDISEADYLVLINELKALDLEKLDKIVQNLQTLAKKDNTANLISEISLKTAKKSLLLSEGSILPSINLNYSKSWEKPNYADAYESQGTLVLSASIPIFPVVDNLSSIMKSKASYKKAEYQKENTQNSIDMAVKSALLNLVSAAQSFESSKLALEYGEQTWEQKNSRFEHNLISTSDMIDADVLLSNAKIQYTSSIYNILRAKSSLMQLINSENEADLINYLK